jgi:hypothetical protein
VVGFIGGSYMPYMVCKVFAATVLAGIFAGQSTLPICILTIFFLTVNAGQGSGSEC